MKKYQFHKCISRFFYLQNKCSSNHLLVSYQHQSRHVMNEALSSKVFFGNDVLLHSLNRKEAYLSKKKQMAGCNGSIHYSPEFQGIGKYANKMNDCKNGSDILESLKLIEKDTNAIPETIQYTNAIRKAMSLKEYNTCFEIFDMAKSVHKIDVNLFATMIGVCGGQRSIWSLNKGLELFVEMSEIYSLIPNVHIYNQILLLCLKTLEYDKGKLIYNDWMHRKTTTKYSIPNIQTYNIMMDLYCKSNEMNKAVEIFHNLFVGKYGESLKPNYVIYCTLINAFSKHQKIDTTQKLFDKCMKTIYKNTAQHNTENVKELLTLTQCLLDGYANIGNVYKCIAIIKMMIGKKHDQYDWTYYPYPNTPIFTSILKALTRCRNININYETCWTIIEWTLQCMHRLNIKKDAVFYGNLFHLTGDLYGNADLDKALNFYKQMKEENIKPGELQISNLLKTGIQYHHQNKANNCDRKAFIKYILSELQEQDIVPSVQIKKLVTTSMGNM